MTVSRLPSIRAPIIALLVIQTFAMFLRAMLDRELQDKGMPEQFSKDLSYLIVVPAILGVMCWPILKRHKTFLLKALDPRVMTVKLAIVAVLIGMAIRLGWWGQLIASISFGLVRNANPDAIVGPLLTFQCPPAPQIFLYLFVMATLVPLIEEVINRGFFLHGLLSHGRWLALILSSVLFALFHNTPGAILNAFVIGLFIGTLVLRTGSLWPAVIVHATYNGLIALDWHCQESVWNPVGMTRELLLVAFSASVITLLLLVVTIWLVWQKAPALLRRPAPQAPTKARS